MQLEKQRVNHSVSYVSLSLLLYNIDIVFDFFCRIKHTNIVTLEDIFESQSHLYLVMEL